MVPDSLTHLHQFDVWGESFLLHIPESRVYKINTLMADILRHLREGLPGPDIVEALADPYPREEVAENLQALFGTGLLTADKEPAFTPVENQPLDTLDLQVSHHCNLACKYCYAEGGNFGGRDTLMSAETGKKAVDFFLDHTDGEDKLCLAFDGGEPLINFSVIKDVAEYAVEQGERRDRNFQFNVGTNATIVTREIADFFAQHHFSPQISLDGPEPIQDELRPFKNKKGAYRELMEGVELFNQKGVKLASRITLTPRNLQLKDTVEMLYNMGVIRIAAFPATGIPGDYAFRREHLDVLKEEYDKTARYFLDTLFNDGEMVCFSNFTDSLKNLHKAKILHYGCGAARSFVSVDPGENLYPCHRTVGNPKYLLGDLHTGVDPGKRRVFLENHVHSKESCRACWARYLCGGGCFVEADYAGGDITTPYDVSCEIYKYEKELSMMMYAEIAARDKALLDGLP